MQSSAISRRAPPRSSGPRSYRGPSRRAAWRGALEAADPKAPCPEVADPPPARPLQRFSVSRWWGGPRGLAVLLMSGLSGPRPGCGRSIPVVAGRCPARAGGVPAKGGARVRLRVRGALLLIGWVRPAGAYPRVFRPPCGAPSLACTPWLHLQPHPFPGLDPPAPLCLLTARPKHPNLDTTTRPACRCLSASAGNTTGHSSIESPLKSALELCLGSAHPTNARRTRRSSPRSYQPVPPHYLPSRAVCWLLPARSENGNTDGWSPSRAVCWLLPARALSHVAALLPFSAHNSDATASFPLSDPSPRLLFYANEPRGAAIASSIIPHIPRYIFVSHWMFDPAFPTQLRLAVISC